MKANPEDKAIPSIELPDDSELNTETKGLPWFNIMIGTGVLVLVILGYLVFFSGDDALVNDTKLTIPPKVTSKANEDNDPYYQSIVTAKDKQDAAKAEANNDSHLANVSGSLRAEETFDILSPPEPEETKLRYETTSFEQVETPQEIYNDNMVQALLAYRDAWKPKSAYSIAVTTKAPEAENESDISQPNISQDTDENQKENIITAGQVFYGQMLTTINSDLNSPAIAEILSGPLSGAKVIGSFERVNDLLYIKFNSMTHQGRDIPINALVVDPETRSFGVADEVDRHYFERFILPIAFDAIKGIGAGFGTPLTRVNINGDTVISSQDRPSGKDQLYNVLGNAGATASDIIQKDNTVNGPTVWAYSNSPVGIAFIEGVTEE